MRVSIRSAVGRRRLPTASASAATLAEGTGTKSASSEGMFFGKIAIEGESEVMTVTLKDVDDCALWSTSIEPKFG